MNITLTGASGFIGTLLVEKLRAEGHELHLLLRSQPKDATLKFSKWDANGNQQPPLESLTGADAVIHLAGEPIAQRWNADVKKRIINSRVNGTRMLVDAIAAMEGPRPRTLIAASAIGYYGDRGNEILIESAKPGKGFLPDVCVQWEHASQSAEQLGIRVALLRIGVVLGRDGGALATMLPFFKLGAGGRIGSGAQYMSWIHLEDLIGVLLFALHNGSVSGPVNGTSPNPVTNTTFTETLADVIHRPAVIPVPEFGLRLLYGEMAQVLIEGQRVIPDVAIKRGYEFRYPELRAALASTTD